MYACLHRPGATEALAELAGSFSPEVEVTAPGTVVFSVRGLRRLIGSPHQIAAEIARRGAEQGLVAGLAIAGNPDSAVLAATNFPGVTVLSPGQESSCLGKIPLANVPMAAELLETLELWGLRTLEDVAALPPIGLAERLGEEGLRIYNLALGRTQRPLRLAPPATSYRERLELEDPVTEIEPLLFYLGRLLAELCRRLQANSIATNRIATELDLEDRSTYTRVLELPVAQNQVKLLLTLLQLDLEAHPPPAPVTAVTLAFHPAGARRLQGGLFVPPGPEPEKLQLTLARIAGMVGKANVGSPELLDTHRPDAFRMAPAGRGGATETDRDLPRLAFRWFRPPLPATVKLAVREPRHVAAPGVAGRVVEAAGPWRSSGDWWTGAAWSREEWDVALSDGGLYRLWWEVFSGKWFVEGEYD
jgi:protein ImuB